MAKLLNFETGKVEEVPDAEVAQRVSSGGFGLKRGAPVHLANADGERFTINPEEASEAFRRGFSFVPEAQAREEALEAEFGDSDGAALAAGAARGLTLGLSDVALTRSGLVAPRTLAGLQEANPVASTVGEVGGAVLPALIPGGQFTLAGAAARAGTGVAKAAAKRLGAGALGKVGAAALAGAAEGALFGAGGAVTESALGDTELTGEKLLMGAGLGAVTGGAGGAAGAGLGLGLGKLRAGKAARAAGEVAEEAAQEAAGASGVAGTPSPAPGPTATQGGAAADAAQAAAPDLGFGRPLEEMLSAPDLGKRARAVLEGEVDKRAGTVKGLLTDLGLEFPTAEKWVMRDLDLTKSQVSKLRESKFGGLDVSAPRALLEDARYEGAKTLTQKLELVQTKRAEAVEAMNASLQRFDELAEPGLRPNYADVAQRIRDEVLAKHKKGLQALDSGIAQRIEDIASELETSPNTTFLQAEELKRSMDPHLRWDSKAEAPLKDALQKVRGILNAEIEAKAAALAPKAGEDVAGAWKAAKRLYAGMTELEDSVAQRADARLGGNRFLSLTDNMAGGAALIAGGLNPAGLAMSAGAAVLNKWGRERLPHLLALWMRRAETGGTQKAASGLKRLVDEVLQKAGSAADNAAGAAGASGGAIPGAAGAAGTGGAFGRYTDVLSAASARGAAALFATHAALADADPEYRTQMAGHGLDFSPEKDAGGHARAERLGVVEKRLQDADARTAAGLDAFLAKRKAARPAQTREGRLEAFTRRADELAQLAAQPNLLTERLAAATEGLGDDAPAVSAALMGAATRGVAFLHGKAPKPPASALDIPALRKPWRPSDAELSRFERYAAAVDNPGGVLEDMAAGTVTREAVEALQAVYPKAFEDVKAKLLERLATHGSALDYSQRLALGQVLGTPLDEASQPARLARLQATFAPAEAQPPSRRGPGGSPSSIATDTQSDTERLLSRRS